MPTLSDIFNLDPNVERLTLLPRLRGSLPSEKSVMMPDRYMFDVIAPKFLYDFIRAVKAPGRAAKGEALDEEEALNTAMNMFGGGLATSGSVPLGALGMSARTAPAGSIPLREVPRSPLGFYSKVEEATLPLQNKGSGGQFLAQIQKTPGVKPEEIEVLGLDKFLQSKPTVTKQEVQDYITANKPDVQEVRLGGATSPYPYRTADEWQGAINRAEARGNWDEAANLNQAWEATEGFGGAGAPKFSKYTIPGGENYREILLTLPETNVARQSKIDAINEQYNVVLAGRAIADLPPAEKAIIDRLTREHNAIADAPIGQDFRSSHFDQSNILTHLRANDRVIDGKKALFIEEIQSDWHQAGRKKGYGTAYKPEDITPISVDQARSQYGADNADLFWYFNAPDNVYQIPKSRFAEQSEALNYVLNEKQKMGVPDAPFKKSWHELALKRAIQEAVDKGYDKLAFTTGKTQAERYDLSKQISRITYNEPGSKKAQKFGTVLQAYDKNGNQVLNKTVSPEELSDYIGKEAAQKLTNVKADNFGNKELAGVDLQVGGEGMKGFYDEILPKALQNLTKKYGTKVTKTTMKAGQDVTEPGIVAPGVGMEFAGKTTKAPEVEVWSMDITPQMREQVKAKGQPLFATAPPLGLATQDPLEQFLGYQEAQNDPLMQFLGYK